MDVNAKLVSPELHSDRYKLQLRCRAAQRCSASDYKNRTGALSAPRENQKPAIEVGIAKFIHLRETMSALSGAIISSTIRVFHLAPSQVWIAPKWRDLRPLAAQPSVAIKLQSAPRRTDPNQKRSSRHAVSRSASLARSAEARTTCDTLHASLLIRPQLNADNYGDKSSRTGTKASSPACDDLSPTCALHTRSCPN